MRYDTKRIWDNKFKKNIKNQQFNYFIKKELAAFLKFLNKKDKLLDLGCGSGDKTNYLFNQGFNVVGLDSSREAIKYAQKIFPNLNFYRQDAISTKFNSNSFDAIASIALFHCLLKEDRNKYVKEVNRILRPGGFLFQLVLSSEDETKISGKVIESKTFLQSSGTPFHLFTEKELKEYFTNFNFIKLKLNKKRIKNLKVAVYTMVLRKK